MTDKITDARCAAAQSLYKIESQGRYSNLETDSFLASCVNLSEADRALYTRLVYGVTEKRLTLDFIISKYAAKPIEEIDKKTLISLRLGVYQLIYTDRIPDFAAVSASVDTAPRRSRGFVNGVLRSFLRAGKAYTLPSGDSPEEMSVKYSTNADICAMLISSYGADTARLILEAFGKPSDITLRVNTLKISPSEAEKSLIGSSRSALCDDMLTISSLTQDARQGIENGFYFVQDPASRIAAQVLGARPGETVADVCAAPGGKSFSVALDMEDRGHLYSFDLHENKLSLIRKTAERLGITSISVAERDARRPLAELVGKCDRVLCDAPCSGIGVLAKKPELRYKSIDGINRLPEIQHDVLCGAAEYVRRGGVLVYSTCTLNRAENEDTVTRFLNENPDFSLVPFDGVFPSESGMLTFMPQVTGTDGFFVAKMIRKS